MLLPTACQRSQPDAGASPNPSSGTAAPSASASAIAVGTRLQIAPARAGTFRVDRIERTVTIPGAQMEPSGSVRLEFAESVERRVELRAVNDAHVNAIAVEYRSAKLTRDGKTMPDARAGKTFLAGIRDGMLEVTDANGAALPAAVAEQVGADHVFLDSSFPLAPFLPDRPLLPGDSVEPSHDAVLAIAGGTGDFDVKELKLVFRRAEGTGATARAHFDVIARFRATFAERALDLELSGPAEAEIATARVRSIVLSGRASTLARGPGEASSHGTAKLSIRSDFE